MSKKSWIIFVAIIVILLTGLVVWSRNSSPKVNVKDIDSSVILSASSASGDIADQVQGDATSRVVFIEYGDYQCPGCGTLTPRLEKIVEEYKDRIAFVFRNFPLTDIHPNAKVAAAAAEAAGLQGKFWEAHTKIYSEQSSWESLGIEERTSYFKNLAQSLGLNQDQFVSDMGSDRISKKLNFDKQIGIAAGVDATPTLYIGNEKIQSDIVQNIQSSDGQKLRDLLDSKLK